ncbi:nucleotidyltransferase [Adhaeribacter rhizoryzae]|uniref:Nucleotidyltransferase family protein n=1 Tax=Adhaeribacter rhizoryzae TaxID=2607907 RepID=A0A5M6DJF7_9BACT|nr:nucleotidyltransferase [Adhaeribacter rhizoryzae]KAA5546392.1 nucleotidyltransferase family protein [Adhaeribacter rhizoryzae]
MAQTEAQQLEAETYYRDVLELLNQNGLQYLVGGGWAFRQYTGIVRDLKDLDLFCKAGEYPKILKLFSDHGYKTELTDVRWLAKLYRDDMYIDLIFNTVNNICTVDDSWFDYATEGEAYGVPVKLIPAEELLWCKVYVQNRERYDGADVNHIIVRWGHQLDWNRIWSRLEQHWHLLLSQVLLFQFVYPTERDLIPKWLFDKLIELAKNQYNMPLPVEKVCLGPIIDQTQYRTDITDWEYKVITIKTI